MGPDAFFAIVGLLVFAIVATRFAQWKEAGLRDPGNTWFVYAEQMAISHQLGAAPVAVKLIRQSGKEYRDLGVFPDPASALIAVQASFRKAGIASVAITANTPSQFRVVRVHHNHRGRAEGKKLGGAVLRAVGGVSYP